MKNKVLMGILTGAGLALSCASIAQSDPDFYYINGVPILKDNLWQCKPYTRERIQGQASISITSESWAKKTSTVPAVEFYTPPPHYVIEAAYRVETSANKTYSASHSTFAEGQKFVSSQEIQDINKRVLDYLFDLNIDPDVKAVLKMKIDELTEGYQSLSYSLDENTHNTARHTASVSANGITTGVRSWYKGHLDVDVLCVPPELKDAATIERFMKLYIDKKASVQSGTWTGWDNRDNSGGNGDFEVKNQSQFANCNALDIEAREVGTSTVFKPGSATPDVLSVFSKTQGLVCEWNKQPDGQCSEYEVRYYCAN